MKMEMDAMNLKILLPFKIFADLEGVTRIVAETNKGSFGFLPQRLDCTAALVPGILEYETINGGVSFIAIDEGILIKAGEKVSISVRNAIGGADLGKLQELVEKEFLNLDEREKDVRSVVAKLESSFIHQFEKFRRD